KLPQQHPDSSFKESHPSLSTNPKPHTFLNPFIKQLSHYHITLAKPAPKAPFQHIQFHYLPFPQPFQNQPHTLTYTNPHYKNTNLTSRDQPLHTIT
ncbi:putative glycoside hydrolase, partial [Staphylococcus haemolyticus]|uniref:putative glycoside hydrolase n=1 Tax=Staphylococcus haemolyticus TaxID=1283 RepID=UPI001C92EC32